MDNFLIGFITSVLTFGFSMSYLDIEIKQFFNRYIFNGFSDIAISIGCLFLAGTSSASLMTVLGLGVGASVSMRLSRIIWGA